LAVSPVSPMFECGSGKTVAGYTVVPGQINVGRGTLWTSRVSTSSSFHNLTCQFRALDDTSSETTLTLEVLCVSKYGKQDPEMNMLAALLEERLPYWG
jgi:hypothetical protein